MAGEIKATLGVTVAKDTLKDSFSPGAVAMNMTTQAAHRPVVSVGTAAFEAVPFGDVAAGAARLIYGRSLDATNYVTIGVSTDAGSTAVTPFGKIQAGDVFCVPPSTNVATLLKWKANAAAVNIDLRIMGG